MDLTTAPLPILPATAPAVPARRSALLAAVAGWIVPGFGQLYMGRPFKALLMLVAIGGLFYGGLALTGFTCVNPTAYALEFAAHAFLGGPTALAYGMTQGFELNEALPWFEVGRLYAAVAGLLNVVAICDALGDVIEHNRGVRVQAALRERWLAAREEERRLALEEAARREAAFTAGEEPIDEMAATSAPAPEHEFEHDLDLPTSLDDEDGLDAERRPQ